MKSSEFEKDKLGQFINDWRTQGLISSEQASKIQDVLKEKTSQREQLAQYFFIIAVASGLLAFAALFVDEKLLKRLQGLFSLSNYSICFVSVLLAAISFWFARRRRSAVSDTTYEVYLLPGALCSVVAIVYLCKEIGNGAAYTLFTGIATIVFFIFSALFRSKALWVICIVALMGWFGAFSTVHSSGNLFFGMNYPMRFTVFGLLVLALALGQKQVRLLKSVAVLSYNIGLLIFFTGLWGISVFGNFGTLSAWHEVRQFKMLPYALVCGIILTGMLLLGIRKDDRTLRDYSILFLLLNLYTHYFEYFWDTLNKGLFFLVLALSFGLLARWLGKKGKN